MKALGRRPVRVLLWYALAGAKFGGLVGLQRIFCAELHRTQTDCEHDFARAG